MRTTVDSGSGASVGKGVFFLAELRREPEDEGAPPRGAGVCGCGASMQALRRPPSSRTKSS